MNQEIDKKIDVAVQTAVIACCKELDEFFPGKNNGGISDRIAGELDKKIRKLLKEEGLIK